MTSRLQLPSHASGTDVAVRLWHSGKSNYWESVKALRGHKSLCSGTEYSVGRGEMDNGNRAKRDLYLLWEQNELSSSTLSSPPHTLLSWPGSPALLNGPHY